MSAQDAGRAAGPDRPGTEVSAYIMCDRPTGAWRCVQRQRSRSEGRGQSGDAR